MEELYNVRFMDQGHFNGENDIDTKQLISDIVQNYNGLRNLLHTCVDNLTGGRIIVLEDCSCLQIFSATGQYTELDAVLAEGKAMNPMSLQNLLSDNKTG